MARFYFRNGTSAELNSADMYDVMRDCIYGLFCEDIKSHIENEMDYLSPTDEDIQEIAVEFTDYMLESVLPNAFSNIINENEIDIETIIEDNKVMA